MFKNLFLLTFVFILTSCASFWPRSMNNSSNTGTDIDASAEPNAPEVEASVGENTDAESDVPVLRPNRLKRTVKDFNLKHNTEEKGPRKRMVVLPFLDRSTGRPVEVLNRARSDFMNELNKTNELVAIDSSELKMDLGKFFKNGEYDLVGLGAQTKEIGISSVLEAKVIDVRFKNQVDPEPISVGEAPQRKNEKKRAVFEVVVKVKIVSARTGQELLNSVKTVTLEDEQNVLPASLSSDRFFSKNPILVELLIKDAFLDFTPSIQEVLQQVMWEGRIAALQGEKVYLNVGQVSGLQIGDILKVVEDGHEVYDPEIGYHIGKVTGKVKGTLEVVGYFGQDGAIGVIHSGAGFKENDRVEIYE